MSESTEDIHNQPYDILEDSELLEEIVKYNRDNEDDRQD